MKCGGDVWECEGSSARCCWLYNRKEWQTGGEEGEVIRHLVQRISVILMRINSNMILNRGHNLDQPQIDGIE